jgi:hypothetical protein
MKDLIEKRVFSFVAEKTGVKREHLSAATALSRDIGMEGDDAVEFFEAFGREFAVDLKLLHQNWSCYFGPEGMTVGAALQIVIPAGILGVVFIKIFPRLPDWLSFLGAFVLWMVCLFCWGKWRGERGTPQITIQDLIECAKVGKWANELPQATRVRTAKSNPFTRLFLRS